MLILLHAAALAMPVAFEVDAVVSDFYDSSLAFQGQVGPGDLLTLRYTYDTDAPDDSPISTVGDYWFRGPPFGVHVEVGSFAFSSDPGSTEFLVEMVNDHGIPASDNYLLRSYQNVVSRGSLSVPVDHISWQLDDATLAALSSAALTDVPPVLGMWDSIFGITVDGRDPRTGEDWFLRAHAASVRRVPAIRATPTALGLVAFDLTGITPRGSVAVLTARSAGHTFVPVGPCAGTDTWLQAPTLRATLRANSTGTISTVTSLPAALSGQWVELVDLTTCEISSAALIQ